MIKVSEIPPDALYGLADQEKQGLLPEVSLAFDRLRERASQQGIKLVIISAYRGFERQLMIWNRKASGKQAVFDDRGSAIEITSLSDIDKIFAILRWSSLPGASRHHWRTDCDVYDQAAVPENYQVQLTREESATTFAILHKWMDEQIAAGTAEDFFRPYDVDTGGVGPEPWHLSHQPSAQCFEQVFSVSRLREILGGADLALKEVVLEHLDEIYHRFIELPSWR